MLQLLSRIDVYPTMIHLQAVGWCVESKSSVQDVRTSNKAGAGSNNKRKEKEEHPHSVAAHGFSNSTIKTYEVR